MIRIRREQIAKENSRFQKNIKHPIIQLNFRNLSLSMLIYKYKPYNYKLMRKLKFSRSNHDVIIQNRCVYKHCDRIGFSSQFMITDSCTAYNFKKCVCMCVFGVFAMLFSYIHDIKFIS